MTDTPSNSAPPPPLSVRCDARASFGTPGSPRRRWGSEHEKLLAGDVATRNRGESLSEKAAGADAAADAIGGVIPGDSSQRHGMSPADLAKAVSWLKTDGGLNDGVVRDISSTARLTAENKASVQRAWARRQAEAGLD